jgi:hypothetical protein
VAFPAFVSFLKQVSAAARARKAQKWASLWSGPVDQAFAAEFVEDCAM